MQQLEIKYIELGSNASFTPEIEIEISSKIDGKMRKDGITRLLGSFVIFSYTRETQTRDIFIFMPNMVDSRVLYYQINKGVKVRSSFITFVILVLKHIGCGSSVFDAVDKGVLYPARCLDPSSVDRLSLFFDIGFIPYLRRDVSGLGVIRKVIDESDPWRNGKSCFSTNASNSIEGYFSKRAGGTLNPCRSHRRLYSTKSKNVLDLVVARKVELSVMHVEAPVVVPPVTKGVIEPLKSIEVGSFKDPGASIKLYSYGPLSIVLNNSGLLATEVDSKSTPDSVLASLKYIFKALSLVSPQGYLNHLDLDKFPVLNAIWGSFVVDKDKLMGREDVRHKRVEIFRWVFNAIALALYERSLQLYREVEDKSDLSSDIKVFSGLLSKHLDSVIKSLLMKRGIGISRNIYTGYDSEYKPLDGEVINKLLTVQLAINSQMVVKIPRKSEFVLSSLNAETGEIYRRSLEVTEKVGEEVVNLINVDLIERSINRLIDSVRVLKYSNYDKFMDMLIKGMSVSVAGSEAGSEAGSAVTESSGGDRAEPIEFSPISSSLDKNGYHYVYMRRSIAFRRVYDDLIGGGQGYSLSDLIRESRFKSNAYLDDLEAVIKMYIGRVGEAVGSGATGPLVFTVNNEEIDLISESGSPIASNTAGENIYDIVTGDLVYEEDMDKLKARSKRTSLRRGSQEDVVKVSITVTNSIYVLCHYTNADLCMLRDFDNFKDNLSKVGKSLITAGRPFVYDGFTVHIRDTMLLSPAQGGSLDALGKLYGLGKVELPKDSKLDMEKFREENPVLFYEYGIQDAVIPLIHSCKMEDFYRSIGEPGFPLTLSGISQKYVLGYWDKLGYRGYQISPKYLIGDAPRLITPKGLIDGGVTGIKIPMYISNYKGGRNESFMYGINETTHWYDYDLTSAYTTVMAAMGSPLYSSGQTLSEGEINKMSFESLVYSYTIVRVEFKFPDSVKYPSIPCYIDENTTVYPLSGEACLTGMEYILAREQGCSLKILESYHIPFKGEFPWLGTLKDDSMECILPFTGVIREVQRKRVEYPKGDINNNLYKQIGNSIYGSVVRGINDKRKVDLKSGVSKRLEPTKLSNPIMASWITAFIRSIIGECLHYIDKLGGKVVSVTTDGFITDIGNLEDKLLGLLGEKSLFKQYRLFRSVLTKDPNSNGLELKHDGSGIISWKTRGQFSANSGISAMTGFQRNGRSLEEIQLLLTDTIKSEDKSLEYVMSTLRSANDIYKQGGHVTSEYKDQIFRLTYDNRRLIVNDSDNSTDTLGCLWFDSVPHPNIEEALAIRTLSQVPYKLPYSRLTATRSSNKYINNTELAVRNFIKGLYADPPKYRLEDNFNGYKGLIDFIKSFDPSIKVSKHSISMLRNRNAAIKVVPRNVATIKFVEHIKTRFPDFDDRNFFSS